MKLLISGIGMLTSVGHDVETACASIRAGVMRAEELDYMQTASGDLSDPGAIVGCPLSLITDGYGSVLRWSAMANETLLDLIKYSSLPSFSDTAFWSQTAVIFTLPSLDSPHFLFEGVVNPDNAMSVYVEPFIAQSELPISSDQCYIVDADNIAVIKACDLVEQILENGDMSRVIVLATDSNVEKNILNWLALSGRLKTPENPVGLMPGEASAALLFETESSIAQRDAKALARVYAHNIGVEEHNIMSDEANAGEALSLCIKASLSEVNMTSAFSGNLYSDLNGEEWKAQEYALAKANINRNLVSDEVFEILPAASLGDIGLVNAAASICMLIESIRRQYAVSNCALILSSSAEGGVASLLVQSFQ